MNARAVYFRSPAKPSRKRRAVPGVQQLELDLHQVAPRLELVPVPVVAPASARLTCEVHQPGEPRRHQRHACAVVRCTRCSAVIERLGAVDVAELGLELQSLPLDRAAARAA